MTDYSGKRPAKLKFRNLLYKKSNWRATITINRPAVHNALNLETLRELGRAFEDASWDDEVAVVILTGAGTKAFCTGADMKEWNEDFLNSPSDFYKWMGVFIETFERLRTIGKPTIARINGMVVGGGNELQRDRRAAQEEMERTSGMTSGLILCFLVLMNKGDPLFTSCRLASQA